jgi:hypothetical protein
MSSPMISFPLQPKQQQQRSTTTSSSSSSSLTLSSSKTEKKKTPMNLHLDQTEASAPRIRIPIAGHKVVVVNHCIEDDSTIPFHCYRCNTSQRGKTIFQWKTRQYGIKIICPTCHEELTRIARRNSILTTTETAAEPTMKQPTTET